MYNCAPNHILPKSKASISGLTFISCNLFAAFLKSFGVFTVITELSPKFKVPQSKVQISGRNCSAFAILSITLAMSVSGPNSRGFFPCPISRSPPIPVVRFKITSVLLERILSTTSLYNSNLLLGFPSDSLTWICAIAAPAFAASIAALAICSGVFGKSGCFFAVSPDPVTAQETKTLLFIIIILY